MHAFIGRKEELTTLKSLWGKKSASLVIIKGRRRIGKSRLVEEFGKDHKFYPFTGLPPTSHTTAKSQRDIFAKQLKSNLGITVEEDNWWSLLQALAKETEKSKTIILFDEISWIGSKDPDFLGILKTVWDTHFKRNPQLILILCGSVSSWIEKNILSSTGFLGRISLTLTLEELSLPECNSFWGNQRHSTSPYEKFKVLAVMGGVPRYLEEIRPHLSAEDNIHDLCFNKNGILFDEFEKIFSDLFSSRSEIYKHIVNYLAEIKGDRNQIAKALKMEVGGVISSYLDDLEKAGFIARDFSWIIKDSKLSKLSHFRLSDNYLRFYLKYILPNKPKISSGIFKERSITSLPGWSSIMGYQFENLVLRNRRYLHKLLEIRPEDVLSEGPYFQRTTKRNSGCQIDYMIQTKFESLYVCEIRFSKHELKQDVIKEIKEKISHLKRPRYFSYRPILIHVNGVSEHLEDSDYFGKIINFSDFLSESL